MRLSGSRLPTRQRGLSLVEVLIALVIGLLTVLVVVNMMSSYSSQQRSARAVDDAQMNALLGMHRMEQDLRMAGHGLSIDELQSCATLFTYFGPSSGSTTAPVADFSTAAVSITDGGAGADSIIVRFAESLRGQRPVYLTANAANTATSINLSSTFGFLANDLVLMANGSGSCALRQVTTVTSGTQLALASTGTSTYNPPSGVAGGSPLWPSFVGTSSSGNNVYALGAVAIRRYAVVGGQGLVLRDLHDASATPIASDIVDMQAQYGVSASPSSSTITQWVNATGTTWQNPSPADRKRIRAVRLALVARSAERAGNDVSPATLVIWPQATSGQTSAEQIFTVPDRRFRYRVLRTVIPLKNLLWADLA